MDKGLYFCRRQIQHFYVLKSWMFALEGLEASHNRSSSLEVLNGGLGANFSSSRSKIFGRTATLSKITLPIFFFSLFGLLTPLNSDRINNN